MKKILICGAGGFIGSHLVEKLVTLGHKVKTIVPYNIDNSWGWIDNFPNEVLVKIQFKDSSNRECIKLCQTRCVQKIPQYPIISRLHLLHRLPVVLQC